MDNDRTYTLITGASAGIGKAMAEACARRGQNLVLVALHNSGLVETGFQLQHTYDVDVKVLELNLSVPASLQYLYDWCLEQGLKINVLINNAGVGNYSSFQKGTLNDYQNMIQLNTGAVVALTRLFIPRLRENRESYILNVGSFAAMMPLPYKSVYSATKSFVLTFSRALQMELKPFKVYVSCLCPGPTSTKTMNKRNHKIKNGADFLSKTPEEVAERAIKGLFKKEGLIIPGWKNRLLISIGKLLPFSLKSYLLKKIFEQGAEEEIKSVATTIQAGPEKDMVESNKNSPAS